MPSATCSLIRPLPRRGVGAVGVASVIVAVLALGGFASEAAAGPPTAIPTGVHVTSVTARAITVAWDPSGDPALAPVVFFDDAARYASWLGPGATEWTSWPQMCGTPHTIGVAYVYNEGDLSEVGPVAWVSQSTTACTGPPPTAPTGLHVIDATGATVTIGWGTPADADVEAIRVDVYGPLFSLDQGNFEAPAGSRTMYGGVCGTPYRFDATFRDTEGQLSPVTSFTATTDDCASLGPAPAGPLELRVVSSTATNATLAWDLPQDPDVRATRVTVSGPGPTTERWLAKTATTTIVSTHECGSAYTASVTWRFSNGALAVPAGVTITTPPCPTPPVVSTPVPSAAPPAPTTSNAAPAPLPTPTASAPRLSLRLAAGQSLRTLRSQGLLVRATCSAACALDARLLLTRATARKLHIATSTPVTVARASGALRARGTKQLALRLTSRARTRLARVKTLRATLRVVVRGNGRRRTIERGLTLTRSRAALSVAR